MTDVAHMKWWGWGVEGVGFHHEDKPDFAPFVRKAVALDLSKPAGKPVSFEDLDVPASRLSPELAADFATMIGEQNVVTDDLERVVHTFGKSIRDLLRIRRGLLERVPDVVLYPADEREVQRIVDAAVEADAVIIPFGGGSNIAGSLEPQPKEERTVI